MRVAKMLEKRITAFVMAALMVLSLSGITGMTVKAAEKDDTITMQLQDTKKIECSAWIAYETKWSVTSGKDKVTLKNTNKKEVSVTADKTGTVTLKCKYKNYLFQWKTEKYTIKISKRTPVFEESISNLTYNGKVQTLNAKNFVKDGPKSGIAGTCDKEILNAGTYTYTITTPATDVYEAGSRTYTVTVNKAEAVIKEKPSATINHMSGKLRESHLNRGMAVAVNDENQELEGHFEWQSPDETLWFNTTGTAIFEDVDHHVVFVPEGDAAENYKETVFIVPVRTYLKALYANLTASDFEYNGSNDEKNLSCDANAYSWGIEKNPSISITYTYYDEAGNKLSKAPVDAGTYTVIATASAKKFESADSNEATFTIRQKTLTNEMVTAKDTEYTGNTVAVVVKDGDKTLVEGKDYTVIYSGSNPNAGETSAAITGIGNYKGTVNTTYTILPKEVENDSVIAAAKEKYYTGKAVTLSEEDVTVTYNGKVLTAGTDYTVGNYKDNVEEGTALATVTFTGNYSGTVNVSFGISKIRAKVYAKYGNGKLLLLSGNCILDPAVLEEAADYATTEESVIRGFILEDENAGAKTTTETTYTIKKSELSEGFDMTKAHTITIQAGDTWWKAETTMGTFDKMAGFNWTNKGLTTNEIKAFKKGEVKPDVDQAEDAPKTDVDTEKVADAVLTEEDKAALADGKDISVKVKVANADETTEEAVKEKIAAVIKGSTIGKLFDITIEKTVDGVSTEVKETKNAIQFTVAIPESLVNTDATKERTYAIVSIHNGEAKEVTPITVENGTITFSTSEFSTYAIVYTDADKTPGTPSTPDTPSADNGNNAGSTTGDANTTPSSPSTGDMAMRTIMPLAAVMGIALLGAAYVLMARTKKED